MSFISLEKAMFPIMVGSMNESDSWSKIITAKSSSKDPQQTVVHLFHLKLNAVWQIIIPDLLNLPSFLLVHPVWCSEKKVQIQNFQNSFLY